MAPESLKNQSVKKRLLEYEERIYHRLYYWMNNTKLTVTDIFLELSELSDNSFDFIIDLLNESIPIPSDAGCLESSQTTTYKNSNLNRWEQFSRNIPTSPTKSIFLDRVRAVFAKMTRNSMSSIVIGNRVEI
ncbi:hypothetical protein MXB_5270 [Myxobolus squamalis]|nr:hypothetical protein MXB_5270 [Myxobolus squamalis]